MPINHKKDYRKHVFEKGQDMSQYKFDKFENADLRGVDLSGQDLSGFNFSHANIGGTKFVRANLKEANFTSAYWQLSDKWKNISRVIFFSLSFFSGLILCYSVSLMLVVLDPPVEQIRENGGELFENFKRFPLEVSAPFAIALCLSIGIERSMGIDIFFILIIAITTVFAILIMSLFDGISAAASSSCLISFLGTTTSLFIRAQAVSLRIAAEDIHPQLVKAIDWFLCFVGIMLGASSSVESPALGGLQILPIVLSIFVSLRGGKIGYKSEKGDLKYSIFHQNSIKLLIRKNLTAFTYANLEDTNFSNAKLREQYIDAREANIKGSTLLNLLGRNDKEITEGVEEKLYMSEPNGVSFTTQMLLTIVRNMSENSGFTQNFNAPVGSVAGINKGNMITYFGSQSANEIVEIVEKLGKIASDSFPSEQREDVQMQLEGLASDTQQPEKPSPSRLKRRIVALFKILVAVGVGVAGTADFANNVLDLSDKLQVSRTEIQTQLQEVKQFYPEFKWQPLAIPESRN
ncbi:pentapeptide repeat-containing protein [Leptothoe sp. EHU-05/26/07-4]